MARQRLATTISITVLAFTLGLHWVMLQSFAWVSMTISYTGETSVYASVKKALDSETTCVLCRVVDASKKAEQDAPTMIVAQELEGLSPGLHPIVSRPGTFYHENGPLAALLSRANAPPTPPPQSCV